MIVCVNCKQEMQCTKNGVGIDFGNGHIYAGDKYSCSQCNATIIRTNAASHHDPEYTFHDEYLRMPALL